MNSEMLEKFVAESAGEMDIGGELVPAINAPRCMLYDLRDLLLKDDAPFAVMYCDKPEGREFVLMSKPGGVNVGQVAEYYRGRGGENLAVFVTPPQKDLAGEFIPLQLEFPPDDTEVLAVRRIRPGGECFVVQGHHIADGVFEAMNDVIAWAYMPELPAGIELGSQ